MHSVSFPSSRLSDAPHLTVLFGTKVFLTDLEYLQGDGNYTIFHLSDGQQLLLTKTLKYYERLLGPFGFIRPNKSYVLNPAYVVARTKVALLLKSGKCFELSRRKRKNGVHLNIPIVNFLSHV